MSKVTKKNTKQSNTELDHLLNPLSDSILSRMKPKLWWGWSTGPKTDLKSIL